ncbi:hypothetical protein BH160DRAFT_0247 [Burkholderia sp. H160]|nr:hypothetical protein BH160DRAFT_0247 [Burkholderia sp. H160]
MRHCPLVNPHIFFTVSLALTVKRLMVGRRY